MSRLTVSPLNFNGLDLLKLSMDSWLESCEHCHHGAQLHVLDNASKDGSLDWLRENYADVPVKAMEKNQILQAYNSFFQEIHTEYVMILNNDVRLNRNSLTPLIDRLDQDPDALGVTPRIIEGEGGTLCRKGGKFFHGHLSLVDLDDRAGGTLLLHGAAVVVRRDRFLELGGFDPAFFYFEDNDLSYRAWRKGYTCWFEPASEVEHTPSSTTDEVYRGVVNRRALKEKGSLLFILKNIRKASWLWNTFFWTLLKMLKMILTLDRSRWWALKEFFRCAHMVTPSRKESSGLSDEEILLKARNLKS